MTVAIRQSGDIKSSVEYIFRHFKFKLGKRVCIKPNLCGRPPIRPGENSSPAVIEALVEFLLNEGCEVSLIHGALMDPDTGSLPFEDILRWAGIWEIKCIDRVKIVNLDHLKTRPVDIMDFRFHLPLEYFSSEVDTYINLAKIKAHMETVVSLSLKNQMGLAAMEDRINMHRTDLEKGIATLALAIRPDLSILEGYPAMEGNGPHHGTPRLLNLLMAGNNMVELDSFACCILGYNHEEIPSLCYARDLAAGTFIEPDKIEHYTDFIVSGFKKAAKIYRFGRRIHAYPTHSCSRCISAVWNAGETFRHHPIRYWRFIRKAFLNDNNIRIIFGKGDHLEFSPNDKILCIGSCSKNVAKKYGTVFLDACPPKTDVVIDYLLKHVGE